MNQLDPRARKIVEQALKADGPGEDERERVRSRLIARLGAAALVAGTAGSAGAASAMAAGSAPAIVFRAAPGCDSGLAIRSVRLPR